MKASLTFFPNLRKKNKKYGSIPIYMRVCFNRHKSECRLNAVLTEKQLSAWDPLAMRLKDRTSIINLHLSKYETKFTELLLLNPAELENHTAHTLRDYVMGKKRGKKQTLLEFVNHYYEKSVVNNVNRRPGTIKNYRRAINHLIRYLKYAAKEDMLVTQVNFEFASDFKNYLVSSLPAIDKIGMGEVSAATIIKKFRTMLNQAVDLEILNRNPFKQVKIITKSPRRERLTIEQVKKIYSLDLTLWPFLELYRNLFLFIVYTGLAYRDMTDLSWSHLEERSDGNIKLTVGRIKTDVMTECFLPKQAIDIINYYKSSPEIEFTKKVLPDRSNQKFNSHLKQIAMFGGINVKLTCHIGRHTFRQLLAEAGIFDMGVIKRMMGHSRNNDIDGTYYQVTEKGLLNAKQKLETFLIENLEYE